MIESIYRKDKDYYPQVFLNECKYVVKEKKISKFITGDIKISSDDSDRANSDDENSNEENWIHKYFSRKYFNFCFFQTLQVPSWNIRYFS